MTELHEVKPGVRSGITARASSRKKGRRQQQPVEIVETDGTPEGDLRAARSEEAATRQSYRTVLERDQALSRPRDVSAGDAERLGVGHVFRLDGQRRRTIDPLELEIAKARTAREREDAALALAAARDKLAPLALEAGNVALAEAAAAYAPLGEQVGRECTALERDFATLVTRAWRVNGLLGEERRAWARVAEAAKAAALSDEARHAIERDAAEELPAELTADGPARTLRRARRRLFGGASPRSASTWAVLGELVRAGPRHGRDRTGRRIAAALDAAAQRINDAR